MVSTRNRLHVVFKGSLARVMLMFECINSKMNASVQSGGVTFILYFCFSQGPYYAQPIYAAAPPHVIHHTTVVQPNGVPHLYSAPVPAPRPSSLPVGMVAGTAMAMSGILQLYVIRSLLIGHRHYWSPSYHI